MKLPMNIVTVTLGVMVLGITFTAHAPAPKKFKSSRSRQESKRLYETTLIEEKDEKKELARVNAELKFLHHTAREKEVLNKQAESAAKRWGNAQIKRLNLEDDLNSFDKTSIKLKLFLKRNTKQIIGVTAALVGSIAVTFLVYKYVFNADEKTENPDNTNSQGANK